VRVDLDALVGEEGALGVLEPAGILEPEGDVLERVRAEDVLELLVLAPRSPTRSSSLRR
jgi:hypothetical protein